MNLNARQAHDFALDGPATERCVVSALELLLSHARVHLTEASFVQAMQHHVDDRTLNDPEVSLGRAKLSDFPVKHVIDPPTYFELGQDGRQMTLKPHKRKKSKKRGR